MIVTQTPFKAWTVMTLSLSFHAPFTSAVEVSVFMRPIQCYWFIKVMHLHVHLVVPPSNFPDTLNH